MKEKSVSELKAMMDNKEDFQLIDVREPHEVEICSIGGEQIPMNSIPDRIAEIAKDKPVVIHCKMGGRSGMIAEYLESNGYDNVYNLRGGIIAWANEIDETISRY